MTQTKPRYCLHSSLIAVFMLFYQCSFSQYNFAKADDWINDNLTELGGRAVMMVFKDGKIIYNQSFNDLNGKQKLVGKLIARKTGKDAADVLQDYNDKSKIPIASCSKWLSAALVMTFVDEGKLLLTDSIGKFLPVMTKNGKGNISIAQCLSHTTGIKPGTLKDSREMISSASSMDDAINAIAVLPMESAPGASFHYSSVGLQLAAAVIEKISGKNFETLFAERITTPCEMTNTDFGHKKVPLAAGGAQSTAEDYLHFLQMILNKGMYNGKIVLQKKSIELMQQNQIKDKSIMYSPAEAGNWGYSFGEWTMEEAVVGKPSKAVSSPGLFGSFPWVDNEHGYAAVLFTFYIKSKGRNERYTALKKIVDGIVD